MKFKSRILAWFGVEPKPYRGRAFEKFAGAVQEAMQDEEMVALIGDPGCGKKTVVAEVVKRIRERDARSGVLSHIVVYVQSADKERVRINNIEEAMVYDLTDNSQNPNRYAEARTRQLARILGKIKEQNPAPKITVIIEQAHLLHGNTIRAIKQLREVRFLDKTEMFGVILIGHRPLKRKIELLNDVCDRFEFELMSKEESGGSIWQWLTPGDRVEYIEQVWGKLLSPKMREQIAAVCSTPLQIDRLVYEKMKEVYARGDKQFSEADFVFDLKKLMRENQFSDDDVAKATASKLSRSTVNLVVNGKYTGSDDAVQEVHQAIAELIRSRQQVESEVA